MKKADLPAAAASVDLLDSWKEIGRHLNCDERTAQRWERTKHLPVRRVPGGTMPRVFALKSELDEWRCSRRTSLPDAPVPPLSALVASMPSVAVLPFLNLASDGDRYFTEGLADEIITALARLPGLRVTARTSSFALRGQERDVREIGRILNVKTVLEGSVRRSGNRIRVTAQLVDTSEGYHLWTDKFDFGPADIFVIQDEITQAVAGGLRLTLSSALRPPGPPPKSEEAHRLWLKGRYHSQRHTPEEIVHSRDLFERAIELDPGFARAHVGLAESWWDGAFWGLDDPREAVAIGRRSALKALETDPDLGEAYSLLGIYLGVHDFDWPAAERAFERALELAPGSAEVRSRYAAWFLEPNLRLDEASAQLELALQHDPLSSTIHAYLGHDLIFRREFKRAAEELQLAVDLEPCFWLAQMLLAGAYAFQGKFERSIVTCRRASERCGVNLLLLGSEACVHGMVGNRQGAEELRDQLLNARRGGYLPSLAIAWFHVGLGEWDRCLDWLEKAIDERHPLIVEFAPKPLYDNVRHHPRFQALLSRMALPSGAPRNRSPVGLKTTTA
jgi:adenylate cyclase